MIRRLQMLAFLLACLTLTASRASAGVPSPGNCIVPCAIVLVGHDVHGTTADPYGEFVVVLRDGLYTPIANTLGNVDFGACCPGIRLSNTQLGPASCTTRIPRWSAPIRT